MDSKDPKRLPLMGTPNGPPYHDMPRGDGTRKREPLREEESLDLSGIDFAEIEMRILLSMGYSPAQSEQRMLASILGTPMPREKLQAIEQVVLVNRDSVEMAERRGVSYEDLKEIFRLAQLGRATLEVIRKNTKATASPIEVSGDGNTVWVNSPRSCVARFCRVSAEYLSDETFGRPLSIDMPLWEDFVRKVGELYGVPAEELEPHKPGWVPQRGCPHCGEAACTFSDPRCDVAIQETERALANGMPSSGRHG